jgi:ADP-ribose pyrophosphatase YjhB (NUDIX family)
VEPGERLADAVARELLEETGLAVEVGPLIEVVEVIEATYHYVILDYACHRRGGELRAGDDAAEVALASLDELSSYGVSDAVRRVVARASAQGVWGGGSWGSGPSGPLRGTPSGAPPT